MSTEYCIDYKNGNEEWYITENEFLLNIRGKENKIKQAFSKEFINGEEGEVVLYVNNV